jgi:hypothetical protein
MKQSAILFVFLFVASWLLGQTNQDQSQSPSKAQVTVQVEGWVGCVSRSSSGHYILEQSGHSYALESAHEIDLGKYVGQQVGVTGSESATLGTSSSAVRSGAASPAETIIVDSINVISERCTH